MTLSDNYAYNKICAFIKSTMKEQGMTVRGLALKAGLSQTIVQDLRWGKRKGVTVDSVLKILKALNAHLTAVDRDGNETQIHSLE